MHAIGVGCVCACCYVDNATIAERVVAIAKSKHANGGGVAFACNLYVDNTAIGERVVAVARSFHASGGGVFACACCRCRCGDNTAIAERVVTVG